MFKFANIRAVISLIWASFKSLCSSVSISEFEIFFLFELTCNINSDDSSIELFSCKLKCFFNSTSVFEFDMSKAFALTVKSSNSSFDNFSTRIEEILEVIRNGLVRKISDKDCLRIFSSFMFFLLCRSLTLGFSSLDDKISAHEFDVRSCNSLSHRFLRFKGNKSESL